MKMKDICEILDLRWCICEETNQQELTKALQSVIIFFSANN